MGGSSYSDDHYRSRVATRALNSTPTFIHDANVRSGKAAAGVHDSLNIHGKIRESRDSAAHPNSNPIGVIFDETGSMGEVPKILQAELPKLMALLLKKAYIEDPQILFGAVGDWPNHERAPLQIGQFESGLEMDDNITHIFLEGNGGGQHHESYQNALYYFAHRTSCDAWEKRGRKGYLFLIGDEMAFASSKKEEIKDLMGVDVEADVPFKEILAAAREKWEVFFILPGGTSYWNDPRTSGFWKDALGENFIRMEDPHAICEVIGATIGLCEGKVDATALVDDLKDVGASDAIIHTATASVGAVAKGREIQKVGTGSLPASAKKSDANERL